MPDSCKNDILHSVFLLCLSAILVSIIKIVINFWIFNKNYNKQRRTKEKAAQELKYCIIRLRGGADNPKENEKSSEQSKKTDENSEDSISQDLLFTTEVIRVSKNVQKPNETKTNLSSSSKTNSKNSAEGKESIESESPPPAPIKRTKEFTEIKKNLDENTKASVEIGSKVEMKTNKSRKKKDFTQSKRNSMNDEDSSEHESEIELSKNNIKITPLFVPSPIPSDKSARILQPSSSTKSQKSLTDKKEPSIKEKSQEENQTFTNTNTQMKIKEKSTSPKPNSSTLTHVSNFKNQTLNTSNKEEIENENSADPHSSKSMKTFQKRLERQRDAVVQLYEITEEEEDSSNVENFKVRISEKKQSNMRENGFKPPDKDNENSSKRSRAGAENIVFEMNEENEERLHKDAEEIDTEQVNTEEVDLNDEQSNEEDEQTNEETQDEEPSNEEKEQTNEETQDEEPSASTNPEKNEESNEDKTENRDKLHTLVVLDKDGKFVECFNFRESDYQSINPPSNESGNEKKD